MPTYTEAQIKAAFWKAFHKCGDVWFSYIGTEEQNESSTQESWRAFEEALAEGVGNGRATQQTDAASTRLVVRLAKGEAFQ